MPVFSASMPRARSISLPLVLAAVLGTVRATPARAQDRAAPSSPEYEAMDYIEPATNRLFFAPTGRTLPAGTWQVGSYQIVAPYANYAPADWFMVSVGTPLIFGGGFGRVWYVAPKARVFDGRLMDVAVGGLGLAVLGVEPLTAPFDFDADAVLAWGVTTLGDEARFITVGVAHPTWGDEGDGEVLIFGGELRLRSGDGEDRDQALKLIGEGYYRSGRFDDDSLAAVGIRFHDRRISFELVGLIDDGAIHRFPFISMSFDL